jgi:endo-beta-N-acetylglucosaminidase D
MWIDGVEENYNRNQANQVEDYNVEYMYGGKVSAGPNCKPVIMSLCLWSCKGGES